MADPAGDDEEQAPDAISAEVMARVRSETESLSVRSLLFGFGPRFARDAFGPVATFYIVFKFVGVIPAVLCATVVSLFGWWWERRNERPGVIARIGLGLVLVYAVVGIITNDAETYLAQPVLVNGIYGLVFLGSVVVKRPLASLFAAEMYPFPPEVKASQTWRKVFGNISLMWGVLLLTRSIFRIIALKKLGVDLYVIVNLATGAPTMAAAMSWSIWYGLRGFRKSEEWGWAFGGETPA